MTDDDYNGGLVTNRGREMVCLSIMLKQGDAWLARLAEVMEETVDAPTTPANSPHSRAARIRTGRDQGTGSASLRSRSTKHGHESSATESERRRVSDGDSSDDCDGDSDSVVSKSGSSSSDRYSDRSSDHSVRACEVVSIFFFLVCVHVSFVCVF